MEDPDLALISVFNFWPPFNEDRSCFLEDVPKQASYISTPISFLESPHRGTTSYSKPAHQPVQLFIVFMLRLHKANFDSVILRFFTTTAVAWVIKSSPPYTAIHHSSFTKSWTIRFLAIKFELRIFQSDSFGLRRRRPLSSQSLKSMQPQREA